MIIEGAAQLGEHQTEAALAQLGERQTEDLKVPGSIPGGGTFVHRSRTQAVKGVDQKSTGLCPRRFESCRLRCFVHTCREA